MRYQINNEFLTVKADTYGATLLSVTDKDGFEYIWQGDDRYWNERGANLFPYIGRLWEKTYVFQGKPYHMDLHGFAKDSLFTCEKAGENELVFVLEDSEETMAQYPFRFQLEIRYQLAGKVLKVLYSVKNRDTKTMYFGIGGHPGFNVPMETGLSFEDYELEFSKPCNPKRILFSKECLVEGEKAYQLADCRRIPLKHNLFDEDAIVLAGTTGEVLLHSTKGKRGVKVYYSDMPYVGFWHMPCTDAPYICIEPWCSLPSRQGKTADLETQEDLLALEADKTCQVSWYMEILQEGRLYKMKKKQGANCEYCVNYFYDEDYECYTCEMNLDEDEMYRFITGTYHDCPYFRMGDEYRVVRKQM